MASTVQGLGWDRLGTLKFLAKPDEKVGDPSRRVRVGHGTQNSETVPCL